MDNTDKPDESCKVIFLLWKVYQMEINVVKEILDSML